MESFRRKQGALDALQEDLVVQGSLCRSTKWNNEIHKSWILGCPLEGLSGTHGPSNNGSEMSDSKMLGNQFMLSPHVVIEADPWKWSDAGIRRRRGLAITKEGWDDNEVFFRAQLFVFPDEPEIVGDHYIADNQ